jgi:hypothetical protein
LNCGGIDGAKETYQEDDRHVQHEGAETVQEEVHTPDAVDIGHGDLGHLPEESDEEVHDGANRGEVVERNQRIHLELIRAQEALDHGKAESLEDDA